MCFYDVYIIIFIYFNKKMNNVIFFFFFFGGGGVNPSLCRPDPGRSYSLGDSRPAKKAKKNLIKGATNED